VPAKTAPHRPEDHTTANAQAAAAPDQEKNDRVHWYVFRPGQRKRKKNQS
jgi:hypothetical protein